MTNSSENQKATGELVVHAAELHRRATVIDAHSDILMPISEGKIRLGERATVPDPATWDPPPGIMGNAPPWAATVFSPHTYYFGPIGQYSIPQLQAGGVTVQVCAIYVEDAYLSQALQKALEMTWCMLREAEEANGFSLVTTAATIRKLKEQGQCGGILAFEGLEPLGSDLRYLDLFYKLGLRMASLTHNRRNAFADGTQQNVQTGGLTDLGREAVKRMNELGIVVDLAHLNQRGFWEVLEISQDPVILSHRSPRLLFPLKPEDSPVHPALDVLRGRERLEALAHNGGVFGVIWYGQKDLDAVADDIEYLIDLIGPDHVGLGSDLYGLDAAPEGLEDISRVPALTEELARRGHSDETITKFLGGNYLRVFEQVWGE
jgi:membrane dipeptidase